MRVLFANFAQPIIFPPLYLNASGTNQRRGMNAKRGIIGRMEAALGTQCDTCDGGDGVCDGTQYQRRARRKWSGIASFGFWKFGWKFENGF